HAILAGYYNAIMMYLTVVNETVNEGGTIRDGKEIVKRMSNRTFFGIAGPYHISTDGHRDSDMALVDMTDPWNGTFQRVGIYKAESDQLALVDDIMISWPGSGQPPEDIPDCSIHDQLCEAYASLQGPDTSNLAIGLSTSISIVVIAAAVAVSFALRMKITKRRTQLTWWKIEIDELQPIKKNMTKNEDVRATALPIECLFALKLLTTTLIIRDMNHPNLLRVVGACLEGDKRALITEHCPKGSLQEVIMDETFKLDNVFCLSILTDILRALIYIHKRSMRYHGRLTSEICMIDSRFSVKVGYYGLPTIYDTIQLQSKEQSKEKDGLWKAPEILKSDGKGSPEGDIYSLAIIMSEVISREEPYSNDKEYLTTQEVLNRIRTCMDPPFRPAVNTPPDLIQLETLMKQCWSEDPTKRPSLNKIAAVLHSLMS
ncbi:unnamed protein product, partial [Candidula unifasciata]